MKDIDTPPYVDKLLTGPVHRESVKRRQRIARGFRGVLETLEVSDQRLYRSIRERHAAALRSFASRIAWQASTAVMVQE